MALFSLPPAFANRMQQQLGPEFADYEKVLQQPAPVSIRINKSKVAEEPGLERVPWSKTGYYLPERPSFTIDPLLHAGAYYVQEASSMFLEQAFLQATEHKSALRVLDLCGAPGGKSTHLASLISKDSLLISNEVIRARAQILAENIQKWGAPNVVVTNSDPREFQKLEGFFDVLVIDAPCSGEGLFRRDPEAMNEWSEANVKLCSERQKRIVMETWDALRPGGILIYSTCTYSPEENELNLAWLAKNTEAESVKLNILPEWNLVEKSHAGFSGYQFYPHKVKGEGLFMAVVRKAGNEESSTVKKARHSKFPLLNKAGLEGLKNWVTEDKSLALLHLQENIIGAFPQYYIPELDVLRNNLHIISAGTDVAEVVKKDFKPLHAFALSPLLNANAFSTADLDWEQALRYLHKEDIALPDAENGWVLVRYKNLPLGWAKKIGPRTNNYYPKEWRIRMDIEEVTRAGEPVSVL